MKFTFAVAGIAAVASAIKVNQEESEKTSFDASLTFSCNDCEVTYTSSEGAEPEQVEEVAVHKDW